jgi:hypothetical protein
MCFDLPLKKRIANKNLCLKLSKAKTDSSQMYPLLACLVSLSPCLGMILVFCLLSSLFLFPALSYHRPRALPSCLVLISPYPQ